MAFRLALWGRQAWRAHKAKEFDNSYRNLKPEFTLFFDRDLYFDNGMHIPVVLPQRLPMFQILNAVCPCFKSSMRTALHAS
jgi:hypothetical protein